MGTQQPAALLPALACPSSAPPRMSLDERLVQSASCALPVHTRSVDGVCSDAAFELRVFRDLLTDEEHCALVYGEVNGAEEVLVRVHSECMTGNTLNSLRCDCGAQFDVALHMVAERGSGVVLYVNGHEGRGIGLTNKIKAYKLQEEGLDTYEANTALHLPPDCRDYSVSVAILHKLGINTMMLLTNNPAKVVDFAQFSEDGQVPHQAVSIAPTAHSATYQQTKIKHETALFASTENITQ